jgi:hypothetical protein
MRKRIPVAPQDIEALGRPGPISKMSFLVKENWPGPKIKLSRAQEILAIGAGYRHLKELQTTALNQGEAFPAPGEITRGELIQIFAWGIHRKCGLPFISALELAKSAGLKLLAVDKLTSEAASEDALAQMRSENPGRLIMMDEYHRIGTNPYDSPWTERLLQAGAHPYSFWVDSSESAFSFQDMLKTAQGLPEELGELLGEDSNFDHIADPKDRVSAYLREEIIPSTARPIGEAIRKEGLLPSGVEIVLLFNSKGQFRGRCLRYTGLNAIVPSIHLDSMIYQDAQAALLGQRIPTRTEQPSKDGEHKGAIIGRSVDNGLTIYGGEKRPESPGYAQFEYEGDEALYTPRFTYGRDIEALMALADEGRGEEITFEPEKLRPLHNIVLRDTRFFADEGFVIFDGEKRSPIENGKLVPRSWGSNRVCGDVMYLGKQALIRDHEWIEADEIPAHFTTDLDLQGYPDRFDSLPVPAKVNKLVGQLKSNFRRKRKDAVESLGYHHNLITSLDMADEISPLNSVKTAIDSLIEMHLPQVLTPTELADLSPDDSVIAIQNRQDLITRARNSLEAAGAELLGMLGHLYLFTPLQLGWILVASQGVSLEDEESWSFDPFTVDDPEQLAALTAQFLLQACMLSIGMPLNLSAGYGTTDHLLVAHLVYSGKIAPADAATCLKSISQLWYRTEYCSNQIREISRWLREHEQSKSAGEKLGLLSVGSAVSVTPCADSISNLMNMGRSLGRKTFIATQSIADVQQTKP